MPALLATQLAPIIEALQPLAPAPPSLTVSRHLTALIGRCYFNGSWTERARHAGAEPWMTERDRPYDESTLRKSMRTLAERGLVSVMESALLAQVQSQVGQEKVWAFTDMYDQVYWTDKSTWAGPIGSRGNRLLAAVYVGMTFVRPTEFAQPLALGLSWHKPASPLHDALLALHSDPARRQWLRSHIRCHVVDRGGAGAAVREWCLSHGVPYLTLALGKHTRRGLRQPERSEYTEYFVRDDHTVGDVRPQGTARSARRITFQRFSRKTEKTLVFLTGARLASTQVAEIDKLYKQRWPHNENAIKGLLAIGFGRNLERGVVPQTSRGTDSMFARAEKKLSRMEAQLRELGKQSLSKAGRRWVALRERIIRKRSSLRMQRLRARTKGIRSERGVERGHKLLQLWVYNALVLTLHRSTMPTVRALSPARLNALLLGRPAQVIRQNALLELHIEPVLSAEDRPMQDELIRLFNEQLRATKQPIRLCVQHFPHEKQELRFAA